MMETQNNVFDSWEIVNDNQIIKTTDKSFFEYKGSGIPQGIRGFFNVSNLTHGIHFSVILQYKKTKFTAYIWMDLDGRTKITWSTKLSKVLSEKYDFAQAFPRIFFTRIKGNYYRLDFDIDVNMDSNNDLESIVIEETKEGKKIAYYTTKYERKQKNRIDAIKIHGCKCGICGFDFEKTYGELGKEFIEVHHLKPLFNMDEEVFIDPRTDLACVCSNCHRMLHRNKKKVLSPSELKKILANNQHAR